MFRGQFLGAVGGRVQLFPELGELPLSLGQSLRMGFFHSDLLVLGLGELFLEAEHQITLLLQLRILVAAGFGCSFQFLIAFHERFELLGQRPALGLALAGNTVGRFYALLQAFDLLTLGGQRLFELQRHFLVDAHRFHLLFEGFELGFTLTDAALQGLYSSRLFPNRLIASVELVTQLAEVVAEAVDLLAGELGGLEERRVAVRE